MRRFYLQTGYPRMMNDMFILSRSLQNRHVNVIEQFCDLIKVYGFVCHATHIVFFLYQSKCVSQCTKVISVHGFVSKFVLYHTKPYRLISVLCSLRLF